MIWKSVPKLNAFLIRPGKGPDGIKTLSLPLTTVAITAKSLQMSQSPFQKFVSPKKNSVIKEEFRQEKKKYRKERNAFFDKKKEEEYQARIAKKNGMATNAANASKGHSPKTTDTKPTAKTPHQKSAKAAAANDERAGTKAAATGAMNADTSSSSSARRAA